MSRAGITSTTYLVLLPLAESELCRAENGSRIVFCAAIKMSSIEAERYLSADEFI